MIFQSPLLQLFHHVSETGMIFPVAPLIEIAVVFLFHLALVLRFRKVCMQEGSRLKSFSLTSLIFVVAAAPLLGIISAIVQNILNQSMTAAIQQNIAAAQNMLNMLYVQVFINYGLYVRTLAAMPLLLIAASMLLYYCFVVKKQNKYAVDEPLSESQTAPPSSVTSDAPG